MSRRALAASMEPQMVQQALPVLRGQHYRMPLEAFLEIVPDNWRAEWVDGEGYIFLASDLRHARVLAFFFGLIQQYMTIFDLGEVFFPTFSVRLRDGRSYREPDIFVVLHEHRDRIRKNGVHGPADFILEGTSADSVERDRIDKFREFEAEGVPEYMHIDTRKNPDELIGFFRRDAEGRYQIVSPDDQGRLHSEVLPGFWIDPRWLREDPLPRIDRIIKEMIPEAYRRYLLAQLAGEE